MARIGYIFKASDYAEYESDKAWMTEYGCVQVVEESEKREETRPQWKQLLTTLSRGDELVIAKFSNAIRSSAELSKFVEYCRVKAVRIISIRDEIDTRNELFPETTAADVLYMIGALPEEVTALRKASAHIFELHRNIKMMKEEKKVKPPKAERDKIIIDMYRNGYTIPDIMAATSTKSKTTVFAVLNRYNIPLDRGKYSVMSGRRESKAKK
ncbi:MAG: recombinase family protein [Alistipes sp.]|nr:recombinase family protein [Alistipes sp.]